MRYSSDPKIVYHDQWNQRITIPLISSKTNNPS